MRRHYARQLFEVQRQQRALMRATMRCAPRRDARAPAHSRKDLRLLSLYVAIGIPSGAVP